MWHGNRGLSIKLKNLKNKNKSLFRLLCVSFLLASSPEKNGVLFNGFLVKNEKEFKNVLISSFAFAFLTCPAPPHPLPDRQQSPPRRTKE
jgi:hypothetical protein